MNLAPWRRKQEGADGGQITRIRNEMDQFFEQFFRDPWGSLARGLGGGPVMDVAESDKEVTVTAELPGVDPKDINIDVSGNTLTVRGEKKQEREEKDQSYHFVERSFGRFQRSVQLPASVDPNHVDAVSRNGTLTITLAKKPDAQRKRIEVKEG